MAAGAKIYELLFRLKAEADGSVSNAFAEANAKMKDLIDTRKQYQDTLGKIETYRIEEAKLADMQKAIDKTKTSTNQYTAKVKELEGKKKSLTTQIDNETRKLQELEAKQQKSGSSSQSLTDKIEKQRAKIQELQGKLNAVNTQIGELQQKEKDAQTPTAEATQKLEDQRNKVERLGAQLKETAVDVGNLKGEADKYVKAVADTNEKIEQQKKETEELGDKSENTLAKLVALQQVADGLSTAFSSVSEAIKSTVESAGDLEYTMAGVSGISGATTEESDELMAKAKEIGATTRYTASEVASAMETAALAGWDTTQMVDGMTAVTNLATAANEDLGEMISITSDALSAFGLSGSEAVQEFTDVLTKSATSSNTTVALMGKSLSYVESTAANLGYSIEDVTTVLATMANQSLKGSVSGSALNTMLTRMSGANTTASKEMDRLNLSMYNADGTAKDLTDFMDELRAKFQDGSMTAQEMQVSAYKLAGQRGMRGLLSIVNTSDEAWQKMIDDVNDYKGAADSIQDTRMDTYQGLVYLLQSAWDALKTTMGEDFLPVATNALTVLTDIVTKANEFTENHSEVAGILLGIAGGLGAMALTAGGLAAVGGAVTAITTAVEGLAGAFGLASIAMGPVLGVAGVAGATTALVVYENSLHQASKESQEFAKTADSTKTSVDNVLYSGYNSKTATNQEKWDRWKALREANAQADEMRAAAEEKYNAAAAGFQSKYGDNLEPTMDTADDVKTLEEYSSALSEMNGTVNHTHAAMESAKSDLQGLKLDFDDVMTMSTETIYATSGLTAEQIEALSEKVTAFSDAWGEAYESAASSLDGMVGITEEAIEATDVSLSDMQKNVEAQQKAVSDYASNLQYIFDSGIDVSSIWDDLTDGSEEAMGVAAEIAEQLRGGNKEDVTALIDAEASVEETVSQIKSSIADHKDDVQDALNEVLENIDTDAESYSGKSAEVAQGLIDGIVNGLLADTSAAETATTWGDKTVAAIKAATGVHSPSTITTDIGKNMDLGMVNGMNAYLGSVTKMAEMVGSLATTHMKSGIDTTAWYSTGAKIVQKLIDGMDSKLSKLKTKVAEVNRAANSKSTQVSNPKQQKSSLPTSGSGDSGSGSSGSSSSGSSSSGSGTVAQTEKAQVRYAAPVATRSETVATATTSGNSIQLTYSPTITGGDTESIKKLLAQDKSDLMDELSKALSSWTRQQERRAYT